MADDSLEYLLNDLLGPDQAKLVMYGSDHASVDGKTTRPGDGQHANVETDRAAAEV